MFEIRSTRYAGFKAVNDASRLKLDFIARDEAREEVAKFRKTRAGKHCTEMFKRYRTHKMC